MKSVFSAVLVCCLLFTASSIFGVTFTNDAVIAVTDTSYESSGIVVSNCTVTINGPHTFANLQVLSGGVITHSNSATSLLDYTVSVTNELHILSDTNPATLSYTHVVAASVVVTDVSGSNVYTNSIDYSVTNSQIFRLPGSSILDGDSIAVTYDSVEQTNAGLFLTVVNNLEIEVGGKIDLVGKGLPAGGGTGHGSVVSGIGSGGGYGGYGGSGQGVSGGTVSGTPEQPSFFGSGGGGPGGASGGGLAKLIVGNLARVDGLISANGAKATNSQMGGGAGGSIWITAETFSGSGTVSANGGSGDLFLGGGGGGGRIALYFATNLSTGDVVARGGAGWVYGGAGTIYRKANANVVAELVVDNRGVSGTNTLVTSGSYDLVVQGKAIAVGSTLTVGNLTLRSNSWLTVSTAIQRLTVVVSGDAIIETNSGIMLNSKGYASGQGLGAPPITSSLGNGGGGYGGQGGLGFGAGGGNSYDNPGNPVIAGSGGGGTQSGTGGGAVTLTVSNTLSLSGQITANGSDAIGINGGGGSGGSVYLNVGTLAGNGKISADGGAGDLPAGGGGGGGRIALFYQTNSFSGNMSALGGYGFVFGGAGTIYSKTNSSSTAQLAVDNGGFNGASTLLNLSANYDLTVTGGATLSNSYGSFSINSLYVGPSSWFLPGTSTLTVAHDVTVAATGAIYADGVGNSTLGLGHTSSSVGSGGGYGGLGGISINSLAGTSYGSLTSPTDSGSAGGNGGGSSTAPYYYGGNGGGIVRFVVNGSLNVDGQISANGVTGFGSNSGGGSGGTVNMTVGRLAGNGVISVNGGAGDGLGGGGGGGRMLINYGTNLFTGSTTAKGGAGTMSGGAGTVYIKPTSSSIGQITIDNGGLIGAVTPLTLITCDLIVQGGATLSNTYYFATLRSLSIGSNSFFLTGSSSYSLTVTGDVSIAAGAVIVADGYGPISYGTTYSGNGGVLNSTGGGGGYGGNGGGSSRDAAGGLAFSTPVSITAGGPGGYGASAAGGGGAAGGGFTMTVNGTLLLDGKISANGGSSTNSGSGGGSGGGIGLTVGKLTGAGIISANGGAGESPYGGGGGGGRVMITYTTNEFSGQMMARGGPGANYGGAGTVYLRRTVQGAPQLVVDNGGNAGGFTPLTISISDLVITGGAVLSNTYSVAVYNALYIGSNSWYLPFSSFTVQTNVVIEAGGGITADGVNSYTAGSGAGANSGGIGGGGGHGGYGGAGGTTLAFGGSATFDSVTLPTQGGGVGGANLNTPYYGLGGPGGGVVNMTVNGTLTLDGKISASGAQGVTTSTGGGAGGTVNLNVGRISGAGSISANGGPGDLPLGGGGGGGRVAIFYNTNNFTGLIAARGGVGWMNGGAGTIYIKLKNASTGQLIIDNAGTIGAGTPVSGSFGTVSLASGSVLSVASSSAFNASSLLIKSNATLTSSLTNQATVYLNITGDLTIERGGSLNSDARGYTTTGFPYNGGITNSSVYGTTGGGGGNGGIGGASTNGAPGGSVSPSANITIPIEYGGCGGNATNGGFGGGAIKLAVGGILTVDGRLTANGNDANPGGQGGGGGGGGGAGGSIYVLLNSGTLKGSGIISANGGAGDVPFGGGGGGGRIALNFRTNAFTGSISAIGGRGVNFGGAGTIYLLTNFNTAQLILANGGNRGALTPLSYSGGLIPGLSVVEGATASLSSSGTFDSLLVASNSWITYSNVSPVITVNNNITIQKGGGVTLSGKGSSSGFGAGGSISTGSGGGGHGGYGGAGIGTYGGVNHDLMLSPGSSGGPGGTTIGTPALGGGVARLVTLKSLILDGDIAVNGASAINAAGGGGAGGSVYITADTFAGSGSIQANGGSGRFPSGGGGAGGMIAVYYNTNTFTGFIAAHGGTGTNAGGAGTIYLRTRSNSVGQIIVDNAGIVGTNTPVNASEAVHLAVSGRANVTETAPQIFTSLNVATDGAIVHGSGTTNLNITVLDDAIVDGIISADGRGLTNGPGSGQYVNAGGGGGYGGNGGDSSSAPGGTNYGSIELPTDRGSGGGALTSSTIARTYGGGALRLQVGGGLKINGIVSAMGGNGLLSGAGGGSGGSIWITSSSLEGTGSIAANGGAGEPDEAGGGGGGRIAVYTHTNLFTGAYAVEGGQGWMNGSLGTVFLGTNFSGPKVISQSVTGSLAAAISSIDLTFDSLLDTNALSPSNFNIETPNGVINPNVLAIGLSTIRLTFPPQTAIGSYMVNCGAAIDDIFGVPMGSAYSNSFAIIPLIISGTITDTNNSPLNGIVVQASGLSATTTDTNGAYTVSVIPTWSGTVTPDTNLVFLPAVRSYSGLTTNAVNQNFVSVTPEAMTLSVANTSTNITLGIFGVSQIQYQIYSSTNLTDWVPYGTSFTGNNSNVSVTIPMDLTTNAFFQFRVSN